jgi:hypothetical protein
MRLSLPRLSVTHLHRRWPALAGLMAVATLLEVAAAAGLAFLAGFGDVRAVLGDFDGVWLIALAAALGASFIGYYYAYRGTFRVEGGPTMSPRQLRAVVAAGFGGFLALGGGVLDQYALECAGAGKEEAKVRAAGLAGLEQGVLAIGGCASAIAVLCLGFIRPNPTYTLPWAILPVPGFLLAFWAAERYRDRFSGASGWRGKLGIFLDSIHMVRVLFTHPLEWGGAVLGMAVFWVADAAAAWAGIAAFGLQMNPASLFVGFATGMVFTRRTGPLAGAGVLALLLPVTIWVSGAPFAVAIVGVFTYRLLALWLPMPVSLAVIPTLQQMGRRPVARATRPVPVPKEAGLE